jgi:hypothetical protein
MVMSCIASGKVKQILNHIKERCIRMTIQLHSGGWTIDKFVLDDIGEMNYGDRRVTALILHQVEYDMCQIVPLDEIQELKLENAIDLDGAATNVIRLNKKMLSGSARNL